MNRNARAVAVSLAQPSRRRVTADEQGIPFCLSFIGFAQKVESLAVTSLSPRSGRQHKAWGGAQRNPKNWRLKITTARGAGDSLNSLRLSPAPRAGKISGILTWGFRCAPPQALRCRPLRGLCSQVAALKRSSQPYSRLFVQHVFALSC